MGYEMDITAALEEICDVVADKVVQRLQTPPVRASEVEALPDVPVGKLGQALEAAAVASTDVELEVALKSMLEASSELQAERDAAVAEVEGSRARESHAEEALRVLCTDVRALVSCVGFVVCPILAEQRKPAPAYLMPPPMLVSIRKLHQTADALRERLV